MMAINIDEIIEEINRKAEEKVNAAKASVAEAYDDAKVRVNAAYDAAKKEDADLANDEDFY